MKWSIPLARVFGIRIGVHLSFFLILAWAAWLGWSYNGPVASLWAVAMMALLFTCVILHELGHSLVAMHYGIQVAHITLLPIGGVAALNSMPEEPRQELLIAIAGPMVNVAILVLLVPFKGFPEWIDAPIIPQSLPELVDAVIRANMILIVFNAIPAFPMDGGRVLRAGLAMLLPYASATAWASLIGRILAVVFVLLGFQFNVFLILIGIFVYVGASAENRMVQAKDALKNVPVESIMRPASFIYADDTVQACLEKYHSSGERHFILMDGDDLRGVLPESVWMDILKRFGPSEEVGKHGVGRIISLRPDALLDKVVQDLWGLKQPIFPVVELGVVRGALHLEDVQTFIRRRIYGPDRSATNKSHAEPSPRLRPWTVDLG